MRYLYLSICNFHLIFIFIQHIASSDLQEEVTAIGFDVETSEVMILMTDKENYPSYKVYKTKLADAFEVEENDVEKTSSSKIPFHCKLMKNEECDAVFTHCVILFHQLKLAWMAV